MSLPLDYEERVYAGVLGKISGAYLGWLTLWDLLGSLTKIVRSA